MRKGLTALVAAALLFSTACATPIAVNFEDTAALIDENGAEIVAPGTYDFIFALDENGDLFSAGSDAQGEYFYALLDGTGNRLSEQAYDMLSREGDAVLFTQNGLYGAMDAQGNVLFEAAYTQLVANGEGGFLGLTTDCFDDEPDGLYFIDANGAQTATGVRTLGTLGRFEGGLMPLVSAENNLYGYVDASGQWAVRAQFVYAGTFVGERAVASLSTGYGLIDRTGNWVLTPKYASLTYDDDALALAVETGGAVVGVDPQTCGEKFRIDDASGFVSAYDGVLQVFDLDAVRLYDYEGNLLYTAPAGASLAPGLNGQYILTDGPWGAKCCRLVEDGAAFEEAWQSLFPLFVVDGEAYYGFMQFDAVAEYSEALGEETYTWDGDSVRYGVIDGAGRTVLAPECEELYAIGDGLVFLRRAGTQGVADVFGNWVYQLDTAGE
ncbi:MAG TPA: WG repeat-containing protein [Candidatus Pullichristensenella avicola]|nr:WG repeat-containing protein [Candidatus Pullichristensenella avicola]